MIDLHLHTTASDGRSTPEALVREAAAAGVHTLAVTDHDTVAGLAAAADSARQLGVSFVPGIEITAVDAGRDVHVLGYFFDPADAELAVFLEAQRTDRRRRLSEMRERLAALGLAVDLPDASVQDACRPVPGPAAPGTGAGRRRPRARHRGRVLSLSLRRPAGVCRAPRRRSGGRRRVDRPGRGAGVDRASGKLRLDDLVRELANAGLAGVEVFHPDHGPDDVDRFRRIAAEYDLVMTGGSDYHGPGTGRAQALGRVGLEPDAFERVLARAGRTRPW